MKPRVLFVVTDDWFFWSHRLHLARDVRDAGFEVHLVTRLSPGEASHAARIAAEGIRIHPVSFGRTVPGQLKNALLVMRLTRIFRSVRPELVHCISFLPILYGALAARRAGVERSVHTVTGLGHLFMREGGMVRRVVERGYRLALKAPGAQALFQNEDDLELFRSRDLVAPERTRIVRGSGVDIERFRPSKEPTDTPVILCCARMLWSKGIGDLVAAGRLLRARGVEHRLLLAGAPHPSNPDSIPEEVLRGWDAEGVATWLGRRDDVPELLAAASVVCLPSAYREGVPLALIEGAAAGRALVSTDMPGCRDIVREGLNGRVVASGAPEALASALAELLLDRDLRARFGRAGRALVEREFSKEVVNAAVLDLYCELFGDRFPRSEAERSLGAAR